MIKGLNKKTGYYEHLKSIKDTDFKKYSEFKISSKELEKLLKKPKKTLDKKQ